MHHTYFFLQTLAVVVLLVLSFSHTRVQGVILTNGDDYFVAQTYPVYVKGLDGNDQIIGLGHYQADHFFGSDGDDRLLGGDWQDHLYGGNNNDFLVGGRSYDFLSGGPQADILYGDFVIPDLRELSGNAFKGKAGDDAIHAGGAGHQKIVPGRGADLVFCSSGKDFIILSVSDVAADAVLAVPKFDTVKDFAPKLHGDHVSVTGCAGKYALKTIAGDAPTLYLQSLAAANSPLLKAAVITTDLAVGAAVSVKELLAQNYITCDA